MKTSGFFLLVLLSTSSFALKQESPGKLVQPQFSTAPACATRPEFLTEMRNDFVGTLGRMPETVLVARAAEYYIEGNQANNEVRLYGYQSFLSESPSQVLCGNTSDSFKERFSLLAPTLIDTYKSPQMGQSLWQFQMMAEGSKFSFWNLKSPSLKSKEDLEQWLKETGAQYKIYQRSHQEYELMIVKKDKETTQYLSIRYDSVPRLRHN